MLCSVLYFLLEMTENMKMTQKHPKVILCTKSTLCIKVLFCHFRGISHNGSFIPPKPLPTRIMSYSFSYLANVLMEVWSIWKPLQLRVIAHRKARTSLTGHCSQQKTQKALNRQMLHLGSQCFSLRFGGHWSSPNLKFSKLREL